MSDPGTQAGLWLGASCSLKKMQAELPLLGLTKAGNTNEAQLMSYLQCVCTCVYMYIVTKKTRVVREESSPKRGSEFISVI